ncbi:major facilitator superfamily domain-containing protein [Pelagophyceae sp. CCMP2097]|nr:major facilitator superfamily domain-containing protein [Pelagophyceae sp. CCMP2097]
MERVERYALGPACVELAAYCAVSSLTAALWLAYSPIEQACRDYYGWGRDVVPSLAAWGPGVSIALAGFVPRIVYALGGPSETVTAASVFVAIAAAARCAFSAGWASVAAAHASCAINSFAGVLLLCTPSVLSREYFAPRHRVRATSTMLAANQLGACLGFLGARAADRPERVRPFFAVTAAVAAAVCVICCFRHAAKRGTKRVGRGADDPLTDDAPLTDASEDDGLPASRRGGVGALLGNGDYVALACGLGLSIGAFTGWQGVLYPILAPLGWSVRRASWLGFASGLGGTAAQLLAGFCVVDASEARSKRFVVSSVAVAATCLGAFTLALRVDAIPRTAAVAALVAYTFLIVGAEGVVYEAATDAVSPHLRTAAGAGLVLGFNGPATLFILLSLAVPPFALTCALCASTLVAVAVLATVWTRRQPPPVEGYLALDSQMT